MEPTRAPVAHDEHHGPPGLFDEPLCRSTLENRSNDLDGLGYLGQNFIDRPVQRGQGIGREVVVGEGGRGSQDWQVGQGRVAPHVHGLDDRSSALRLVQRPAKGFTPRP